jgi:hypothetical protein
MFTRIAAKYGAEMPWIFLIVTATAVVYVTVAPAVRPLALGAGMTSASGIWSLAFCARHLARADPRVFAALGLVSAACALGGAAALLSLI